VCTTSTSTRRSQRIWIICYPRAIVSPCLSYRTLLIFLTKDGLGVPQVVPGAAGEQPSGGRRGSHRAPIAQSSRHLAQPACTLASPPRLRRFLFLACHTFRECALAWICGRYACRYAWLASCLTVYRAARVTGTSASPGPAFRSAWAWASRLPRRSATSRATHPGGSRLA
jgi:hypothetical protein